MKKNQFLSFIALILAIIFIFSCNKNEVPSIHEFSENMENDVKQNEATWISLGPEKALGLNFNLLVGHSVQQCGGKCIKFFGEYGHIDCRGFGNACSHVVNAYYSVGDSLDSMALTLIEVDLFGTDLEYPLPDRSFHISNPQNNTDIWLNIPEQVLQRSNAGEVFVIHNIWFSEEQEIENK